MLHNVSMLFSRVLDYIFATHLDILCAFGTVSFMALPAGYPISHDFWLELEGVDLIDPCQIAARSCSVMKVEGQGIFDGLGLLESDALSPVPNDIGSMLTFVPLVLFGFSLWGGSMS
jgi:hypothetical protein